MDIQTIEDEINLFNTEFFKDVAEVSEEGLDFIANNRLYEPKENYTILFKYLNMLFNYFKSLDYLIINTTLVKLQMDITYIESLYKNFQNDSTQVRDICKNQLMRKSKLLSSIEEQLNKYKKVTNISVEERKALKKDFSNYERLRIIYFETFQEIFVEDRDYFLSSLLQILNTKLYYLEKLLWVAALESETIRRALNKVSYKENIGSKDFIVYKLKIIMPYSQDYIYLQKCLRIFK